jgi:hypothetical protein
MSPFWSVASDVSSLMVWFGIPAYVIYRRPKAGARNLRIRFIVGVLGTWFGLLLHREFIGLPIAMARARADGDLMYDGVAVNGALLVLGWVFGLISSTVALIAFLGFKYVRQRRQRQISAQP